ncbi:MAG: hypothetical protein H6739_08820 [Alphaproteobacteria bacterium]|nr:hypothetical protein [Alphaproteobacteria bacterium]
MLVLDSCALLHAKQLGEPLELACAVLVEQAIPVAMTKKLYGQHGQMGLRGPLDLLGVQTLNARTVDLRRARNQLSKSFRLPEESDQEAVVVAWVHKGAVLTHDRKACQMAHALGVPTGDLLDLLAFGVDTGVLDAATVNIALTRLPGPPPFAWQPLDAHPGYRSLTLASVRQNEHLFDSLRAMSRV